MQRPELIPENHLEIYQYFEDFEASERIQNLGFAVMHAAFKADVHYVGEAEKIIQGHLEDGGNVIMAPNHHANADTPTIAGLVYEDCFASLRGNTIIPAKAEMFDWPLLGRFFPHMQAHPTFRYKDYHPDKDGNLSPEAQLLKDQVRDGLIDLNINYINNGGNVAIFHEGKRNKGDPRFLQEPKLGIGLIAEGVEDPSKLLVVTMAFAYKNRRPMKLRPVAVVNEPFSPAGMSAEEIMWQAHGRIQDATTTAFDLAA